MMFDLFSRVSANDEEMSMRGILLLCTVMYGSIAALWVASRGLDRQTASYGVMMVGLLCVSWSSMSIGMHVLNKSLAANLAAPGLISLVQMAICAGAMLATSFHKFLAAPVNQLKVWLFVPIFFAGMLCSSFYTFEYISLSLLTIVRNMTPLIALPTEMMVMPAEKQPKVSNLTLASFAIMLTGATIYCGGIEISIIGLMFAGANMIMAVSDRVIQRRLLTNECKDLPSDVCALMSNTLGMLPSFALAFFTGELVDMKQHSEKWVDPGVVFLLVLSGFVGLGINYLGFECQRAISATSFFVLQNMTKLAVVGMGVALFGDPVTFMTSVGMLLSVTGSAMYGWSQMNPGLGAPVAKGMEAVKQGEKVPLLAGSEKKV